MLRFVARLSCIIVLAGSGAVAAASEQSAENCAYRQAALSLPAIAISGTDVGDPWRALYGYCLLSGEQFVLHQDWILSYLDAEPMRGYPGGTGVGFGTDLHVRWHPNWRPSLLPYIDIGIGLQYAAGTAFPADGSRWMFAPNGGFGWLIPLQRERQAEISLRYLHISNAGFVDDNSGYDVIHLILGLRWGKSR